MQIEEPLSQADAEKLLREWFFVGQRVTAPDTGKEVTVIGFEKKYIGHGDSDHKRAGTYLDFNRIRLSDKYTSGSIWRAHALALYPKPQHATFEKMLKVWVRIGDLPETPFWVGDKVCFTKYSRPVYGVVGTIRYNGPRTEYKLKVKVDTPSMILTDVFSEKDLSLVERGNVWKLEHGEKLSFASLDEEAKFYKSLGMSRRWESGMGYEYGRFTFGDALGMIKSGQAHEMIYSEHKDAPRDCCFIVIEYEVPQNDFAERMRAHTLKRWTA